MAVRTVPVAASVGLHARPASLFVQEVMATGLPVTIACGDRGPVDGRSMLGVMTLGARHGEEVTLTADGEGAEEALDRLVEFLSRDLDSE
ncbi:Phosphocarrier protein HPr [Austwickia chelonae]|uniref:Phosphocarrier protein HPr n=1 Tax=Austwickia chelonae NBRC 105200 TaxID=1184607 RepID=K6VNH6_9MICO|nr:HPr family phosphocarrier protein [Austwickia chelonae]GAB76935.1 phosphocarrier protein HPr [Austwickia chelonae NBRC 105200]SEW32526.1 Phosphocarrier protein HPr [Austwickia chelonae]